MPEPHDYSKFQQILLKINPQSRLLLRVGT